jgi:protein TonB
MAAAAFRDDPWRRVPWLLPSAAGLTLLALMGFLKLLAGPPFVTPPDPAVEVEVVELAPSPLRAPPAPPPPPSSEPPPLAMDPPPPPPLVQSTPPPPPEPQPDPLPAPVAKPAPPPPPPRPARPQRSAPSAPPPVAAAPVPPSPAPAPPVASAPPSGNMGARAIYQPLPEIPDELRRRAIDLVAVARFRVAANGSAEVELIEPTPDAALNRALVETLKKWRFFPAVDAGKPVASTLEIRIPISVR